MSELMLFAFFVCAILCGVFFAGFTEVMQVVTTNPLFLMAIETCTPLVSAALNSLILATNITYAIIKCTPFLALIAWILTILQN